jgi:hypothetical protein
MRSEKLLDSTIAAFDGFVDLVDFEASPSVIDVFFVVDFIDFIDSANVE